MKVASISVLLQNSIEMSAVIYSICFRHSQNIYSSEYYENYAFKFTNPGERREITI